MTYDYETGQPSSTDGSRTDAAREAARDTAHTAKDQASGVAHSAAESGQHLAREAKSEAKDVGREAGRQAKQLLGQGREQLTSEASSQQQKLAGSIRSFGQELGSMADSSSEPGMATDLARQASQRIDEVASFFENREPGELLGEVKRFAQGRPGTFLALAAGAGLLAGRLTRGVKEISNDESQAAGSDEGTEAYGAASYGAEGVSGTYGTPTRTSAYGVAAGTAGAAAAPTTSTYGTGAVYGEGTDGLGTADGDPTYGVQATPGTSATYPEGASSADPYGTGTEDVGTPVYGDTVADTYGTGTQNPPSGAGQYAAGSAGYGQDSYGNEDGGIFGGGTGEVPEHEATRPWSPVDEGNNR
ncbi:hypothetical protein [Actinotalea sp. Marseille-Q4924]|uniref:hypothetical protein n=1 Tax=Actinotalea sp. Marseille-Q4924 TaxID=2866571 RepID=UPI001CE3D87B|nr:hypothetical protein [Actinotalea sp. Marseille-Q4924]